MRFASSLSLAPTLEAATREVAEDIAASLQGATPDLLVAFVSAHHEDAYAKLPDLLARGGARVVVGCSAGGVIGGGREIERRPGLAVCGISNSATFAWCARR
jgi:small ligand-binding sensory domain FIST